MCTCQNRGFADIWALLAQPRFHAQALPSHLRPTWVIANRSCCKHSICSAENDFQGNISTEAFTKRSSLPPATPLLRINQLITPAPGVASVGAKRSSPTHGQRKYLDRWIQTSFTSSSANRAREFVNCWVGLPAAPSKACQKGWTFRAGARGRKKLRLCCARKREGHRSSLTDAKEACWAL